MEKNYTYEVTENGYYILVNGVKTIHQYEPFIPDKTKSYEENAIAQIAELQAQDEQALNNVEVSNQELQEQITELQLAMVELAGVE